MAYAILSNDNDMINDENNVYQGFNLPGSPSVPDNSGTRPNSSNSHGNNEANNNTNSNNAENVERLYGHDEIFDPAVSKDYVCPICMTVSRNPVQTTCGHRFCGGCIKEHFATNGRTCHINNQELNENELYPDNFAQRKINQFTVKCRTVKNKEYPRTGLLLDTEYIELTADHEKECPKAQAVCEFKAYGCEWTGLRHQLQNHLKNKVSMATHLSLLCKAMTVLLPSNGRDNKDGTSKFEASASDNSSGNGAVSINDLEEFNRQLNRNAERLANVKAKIEQEERKYREFAGRVERSENTLTELEGRMCNGVYLWRITGYPRHLENARDNVVTALYSPPFYTNFYGYKFCLRINPNGVDTGYGSHVSLFVHMMQSDWDDTLKWPFSGRISLSILDQSDDGECKRHISEALVTRPNLQPFQRPTTRWNHKGYGCEEFARIETVQDRQYLKNDCLLVCVQVFQ